jgi:hypothetical protein
LIRRALPDRILKRKEVTTMEYQKPEIFLAGKALDAIESSLDKNFVPIDADTGTDLTSASAYEADE